jgi:hypothetical protein
MPGHIAQLCRVTGGVIALALGFVLPQNADAVVAPIHTLPFFDSYSIGYGFGEYTGHEGTDHFIGTYSSGGERVVAASGGTAIDCYQSGIGAGNFVVMDHGNGQRTRYLHLNEDIINDGDIVARVTVRYSVHFTSPSTPHSRKLVTLSSEPAVELVDVGRLGELDAAKAAGSCGKFSLPGSLWYEHERLASPLE